MAVSLEIFQQVTGSLESRLGIMEGRLTELFNSVDRKFVENTGTMKNTDDKLTEVIREMGDVKRALMRRLHIWILSELKCRNAWLT